MTTSAVIAVFNGSRTIRAALDSVLRQTLPPDEILVIDDGSTDDTFALLKSYTPRVTLFRQENMGVAATRNALCARAKGDLIGFLDSDDLWHPRYLETIHQLFNDNVNGVAFFTGHVNFAGYGDYIWDSDPPRTATDIEVISQLEFLRRYNRTTGYFASMSYCSLPKRVITALGKEPFRTNGVEDSYLCTTLPLYGPVVYTPSPLAAYRVTNDSLSVNRLKLFGNWVRVFELLEERYNMEAGGQLRKEFRIAYASKKRQYGKLLMAAGNSSEARRQFWRSIGTSSIPPSVAKSIAFLLASYLPSPLQPKWPPLFRQANEHGQEEHSTDRRHEPVAGPRS
jgi:glycosyltransferase involved in cell wall biosynthesis